MSRPRKCTTACKQDPTVRAPRGDVILVGACPSSDWIGARVSWLPDVIFRWPGESDSAFRHRLWAVLASPDDQTPIVATRVCAPEARRAGAAWRSDHCHAAESRTPATDREMPL